MFGESLRNSDALAQSFNGRVRRLFRHVITFGGDQQTNRKLSRASCVLWSLKCLNDTEPALIFRSLGKNPGILRLG
jgi:hypothetical protein